jgi:hypothetical protein
MEPPTSSPIDAVAVGRRVRPDRAEPFADRDIQCGTDGVDGAIPGRDCGHVGASDHREDRLAASFPDDSPSDRVPLGPAD